MKNSIGVKAVVIGGLGGLANGLFGAGGGALLVPAMKRFLQIDPHKAHATAVAVTLPLSVVSAFVYGWPQDIGTAALLAICGGGLAGGIIGAKWLKKVPKKMLRKIFATFIIIAAVRMLL